MKHRALITLVTVLIIIFCFSSVSPFSASTVDSVTSAGDTPSAEGIRNARFHNMLNHNFVYGTDFDYTESVVNNAVISVLNCRDSVEDSFIAESYVADFVYNMYGIRIGDTSLINPQFPQREGYIYIIPRGLTLFSHEIKSSVLNEDGSYTVTTEVTVSTHDGQPSKHTAVSLFVKNADSEFGYNIVSSDILENTINI